MVTRICSDSPAIRDQYGLLNLKDGVLMNPSIENNGILNQFAYYRGAILNAKLVIN